MPRLTISSAITVSLIGILFPSSPAAELPAEDVTRLEQAVIGVWDYTPIYTLGERAQNAPGLNHMLAKPAPKMLERQPARPPLWYGLTPTEHHTNLIPAESLPREAFSIEAWMLNHVNRPVGALVGALRLKGDAQHGWLVGMYERSVQFGLQTRDGGPAITMLASEPGRGFHKWLYHVVGTYDGRTMRLYLNGESIAESSDESGPIDYGEEPSLDAVAYLEHEPFMTLGELVKNVRLYDRALTDDEVGYRFDELSTNALEGRFNRGGLHFTVGPHLQMAQEDRMTILWETDRESVATLEYGRQVPMEHRLDLEVADRLHEVTLTGLESGTPYFYKITAQAGEDSIDSGVLTFRTAPPPGRAYAFAVIADTEARAHIADRIAKLVWGERPDFLINCGDLTDSGKGPNRFEWVYEYFSSMTQLLSRIPSFPVPGNGEGDLVWYTRYHALPEPEYTYTFTYGNAQFFMLDSNQSCAPGSEQYEWLSRELKASDAKWKFAAHHHPVFTSDEDDYGDTWEGASTYGDANVQQLVTLYEANDVDVVWYGHMHYYERSWPVKNREVDREGGVMYIQAGGAGGNFEDLAPTRTWFMNKGFRGHHYCLVRIHDGFLDFKMYDVNGRLRDSFELSK